MASGRKHAARGASFARRAPLAASSEAAPGDPPRHRIARGSHLEHVDGPGFRRGVAELVRRNSRSALLHSLRLEVVDPVVDAEASTAPTHALSRPLPTATV